MVGWLLIAMGLALTVLSKRGAESSVAGMDVFLGDPSSSKERRRRVAYYQATNIVVGLLMIAGGVIALTGTWPSIAEQIDAPFVPVILLCLFVSIALFILIAYLRRMISGRKKRKLREEGRGNR